MNTRQLLENTNEIDDEPDIDRYSSCCAITRPFRPLLNLGPAAGGFKEALDVASLYKLKHPLAIVITTSAAAFLSSIELTGETTRQNFDITCDMIKRRSFPNDWPILNAKKETIAICLTIIPALFAPFSESVQTYYFVDTIPNQFNFDQTIITPLWPILSGMSAFLIGMTVALTESVEMYKVVRERLAGQDNPYKNTVSKIISPTLGGTLSILDSLQKSIQIYIGLKTIFNTQSLMGKILIGIPCMVYAVPYFCFSGIYTINALDDFFGVKKPCKPRKIVALGLSLTIAVYLGFYRRYLNKASYPSVLTEFGINPKNIPAGYFETFSWVMFVQETILTTATLYSPMYMLISSASNKISQGFNCIHGFFCRPKNKEEDIFFEDKAPLLLKEIEGEVIEIEHLPSLKDMDDVLIQSIELRVSTHADTLFGGGSVQNKAPEVIEENKKITDWCVLF